MIVRFFLPAFTESRVTADQFNAFVHALSRQSAYVLDPQIVIPAFVSAYAIASLKLMIRLDPFVI